MEQKQQHSSNQKFKFLLIIVFFLLLASICFNYIMYNTQEKDSITQVTNLTTEKDKLQAELEARIEEYKTVIAENAEIRTKLEQEKAKLVLLLEKLIKSDASASSLAIFKAQFERINIDMNSIVAENNVLKEKNEKLIKELEASTFEIKAVKNVNDTLRNYATKVSEKLAKSTKISLSNLEAKSYMINKRTKNEILTDKAHKVGLIKVSFTIAENLEVKKGDRIFYIQIIDSRGNVIGEKKGENLNGNFLFYSMSKVINYTNGTYIAQCELPVRDLFEGLYKVNVYDKEGNVLNSTLYLR